MNLEKMMETYKRENSVTPREEKILETIQKSKEIVMEVQSENTMSYTEFLFSLWYAILPLSLYFSIFIATTISLSDYNRFHYDQKLIQNFHPPFGNKYPH